MTEPLVHTAQGLFDASNEALNILLPAANQQLGIVGVLHNGYLAGHTQAQVVSEQHIQDTAESPTLEDANIVVSERRQHVPPTSRAHTNLLGVVSTSSFGTTLCRYHREKAFLTTFHETLHQSISRDLAEPSIDISPLSMACSTLSVTT